jgi:hypothetical protein
MQQIPRRAIALRSGRSKYSWIHTIAPIRPGATPSCLPWNMNGLAGGVQDLAAHVSAQTFFIVEMFSSWSRQCGGQGLSEASVRRSCCEELIVWRVHRRAVTAR